MSDTPDTVDPAPVITPEVQPPADPPAAAPPVQQSLAVEPAPEVAASPPAPAAAPESAEDRIRKDPALRQYLAEEKAKAESAAETRKAKELAEAAKRSEMDETARLKLELAEERTKTADAQAAAEESKFQAEMMRAIASGGVQLREDDDLHEIAVRSVQSKMATGADMETALAELQAEKDYLFRTAPPAANARSSSQPMAARAPTAPPQITTPQGVDANKMTSAEWRAHKRANNIPQMR